MLTEGPFLPTWYPTRGPVCSTLPSMVQATKAAVELSILAAMIWGGELGADPGCVLTTCSAEGSPTTDR